MGSTHKCKRDNNLREYNASAIVVHRRRIISSNLILTKCHHTHTHSLHMYIDNALIAHFECVQLTYDDNDTH